MASPKNDPELESMFMLSDDDDEDDDSDDEYFPDSQSGRILKEVEFPYNRSDRILQANRELFSEPPMKKKQPCRVTFNQMPTVISQDKNGKYMEILIPMVYNERRSSSDIQRRATFRRRNTPAYRSSSVSGHLVIPRLIVLPTQTESLASTSTTSSNQDRRENRKKEQKKEDKK